MYFCCKCGRKHKSGKLYEPHKVYEKREEIPCDEIIEYNHESLRGIAQRQINRYYKRMRQNSLKKEAYIREINRVILYERRNINK